MLPVWKLHQSLVANVSSVVSPLWCYQKSSGNTAGLEYHERSDQSPGGFSQSVTIAGLLNRSSLPVQEM